LARELTDRLSGWVIGDRDHPEVQGIVVDERQAFGCENPEEALF
jgi:hypothetical protein